MNLENYECSLLWAKETLEEEAKSLELTAKNLDHNFSSCLRLLNECSGKVVISGLGKSGHVAKKISATLSSSGTPSVFLHPSEALHGDLGILSQKDILLTIAYSGETYETVKVAKHAKSMGLSVISITGNPNSSLGKLSDFCLDGSVPREVCPNELAPTSSTLVAMALGDALAVSLMRTKKFTSRDFARFHPEGTLGRRLSLVGEFLRKDLKSISPETPFEEVIQSLSNPNYGICVITDSSEREVLGVVTDGDLRRYLLKRPSNEKTVTALDLMTRNSKKIQTNESAYRAGEAMEELGISALVVVNEKNEFEGIIRLHDLVRAKII